MLRNSSRINIQWLATPRQCCVSYLLGRHYHPSNNETVLPDSTGAPAILYDPTLDRTYILTWDITKRTKKDTFSLSNSTNARSPQKSQ